MSNVRFYDIQLNKQLNVREIRDFEVILEAVNNQENGITDGKVNVGGVNYSLYRTTINTGQNVSASVSFTSAKVNFLGWYYDRQGTVLYSTNQSITWQAAEGGVHLYAIFEADRIEEPWCYHESSVSHLCNNCDKTLVYFDKSDLLDVGYGAITWYGNYALSSYATTGYYTSTVKSPDTPIFFVDSNGQAQIIGYCDGDQISCGDDPANDDYGSSVNLEISIDSVSNQTGTTNLSYTGATPNGKLTINASSTFEGNWSGNYDAACLSLYLRGPATGTLEDDDTGSLNTVQTFHTFFTITAEIEVTADANGDGTFKVVNVGQNFSTPSGGSYTIGSTCGITVTDNSSGQSKNENTSTMLITSNTGYCTGGTP